MKKIGIAGIGGIGSNVAVHLVRSGFLSFKIVDFDKVEESNLNRQFYFYDQIGKLKTDALEENLKKINNNIIIEKGNIFLDENNILETFKDCDLIVEGFDQIKNKIMILEIFGNSSKTIVSACGVAGLNIDNIKIKNAGKNILIVGDFETDFRDKKLYSPKIFIQSFVNLKKVLNRQKKD